MYLIHSVAEPCWCCYRSTPAVCASCLSRILGFNPFSNLILVSSNNSMNSLRSSTNSLIAEVSQHQFCLQRKIPINANIDTRKRTDNRDLENCRVFETALLRR